MNKVWWFILPLLCLGILLIFSVGRQPADSKSAIPPRTLGQTSPGNAASMTLPISSSLASTLTADSTSANRPAVTSFLVLRVGLALILVVVLIFGTRYTLRASGWNKRAQQLGRVQVLERCWLGPRKALYTVRIGSRHVVVGVTEASIQPVLELSSEEGASLYPELEDNEVTSSFAELLRTAVRKVGGR